MRLLWWQVCHLLGVPPHAPSYREQLAAVMTAMMGIALVAGVSAFLSPGSALVLLASMGATAVLVFAVPHGPLSQPWPVLGGHLLSAVTGVAVARYLGGGVVSAALAVGLSVGVMHLARCIHPPGGATALSAVLAVTPLGPPDWGYLLSPVMSNVAIILLAAVACNFPFAWRRYPASLAFRHPAPVMQDLSHEAPFSRRELAEALDRLDTVIDISDEQLQVLYEAILRHQQREQLMPEQLVTGGYYSNGLAGEAWAVRQIIDANEASARKPQLIVKTVAGHGRGAVQLVSRQDFVTWARYPVYPEQGQWERR